MNHNSSTFRKSRLRGKILQVRDALKLTQQSKCWQLTWGWLPSLPTPSAVPASYWPPLPAPLHPSATQPKQKGTTMEARYNITNIGLSWQKSEPPYLRQLLGICKIVHSDSQEDVEEGIWVTAAFRETAWHWVKSVNLPSMHQLQNEFMMFHFFCVFQRMGQCQFSRPSC